MDRITAKRVEATYATFVELAGKLGFNTEHWGLQTGNQWRAYRLYVVDHPGAGHMSHPMADYIGSTAREAYNWLSASIHTMSATLQLHKS